MSDCIVKPKNYEGYRRINFEGRLQGAHRVAWIKAHGPVPDGMDVCHSCNNKECENPDHLYLGTRSENISHAHRDGLCNPARGERQGSSRLKEHQVLEIRASELSRKELAEMYGVAHQTIDAVINRRSWRHI